MDWLKNITFIFLGRLNNNAACCNSDDPWDPGRCDRTGVVIHIVQHNKQCNRWVAQYLGHVIQRSRWSRLKNKNRESITRIEKKREEFTVLHWGQARWKKKVFVTHINAAGLSTPASSSFISASRHHMTRIISFLFFSSPFFLFHFYWMGQFLRRANYSTFPRNPVSFFFFFF